MQQVGAHGMPPVHVAPIPAVGVVLIEQVIFTVIIDQAVRVVDPPPHRGEVHTWPVPFAINAVLTGKLCICVYRIERRQRPIAGRRRTSGSAEGRTLHFKCQLPALVSGHVEEHPEVGIVVRQFKRKLIQDLLPGFDARMHHGIGVCHGKVQIFLPLPDDDIAPYHILGKRMERKQCEGEGQNVFHRFRSLV